MAAEPRRGRSALRPFDILEAFRVAGRPLLLSEVARLTGTPVSTCHGVLRALEESGYLYFLSSREAYPTRRLLEMAQEINANDPVVTRIAPLLEKLRDATGETVVLAALQNDHAVNLVVVESQQNIRYASRPGDVRNLHSTSLGKAMLLALPEAERLKRVDKISLKARTGLTITSKDELLKDLEQSVARGYALSRGENSPDVMAIAMPVRLAGTALAVAVAGPIVRVAAAEASIVEHLRRCVEGL